MFSNLSRWTSQRGVLRRRQSGIEVRMNHNFGMCFQAKSKHHVHI